MGLWEVLRAGGSVQNIAHVEKLTDYAAGELILVRDTFPDYTMHDERHTKNVIARMEDLLGSRIEEVTPLEAAMLILAAYFHDIGMVYHPDELAALGESEDFRAFLDENPAAYVAVHESGEISGDVIVQYCRARHAQRVDEYVFRFETDELFWGGAGIADELARLCRSHNEPLDRLRDKDFPTNFLGQCDLRMCAILLRLADILDLDESRSPLAVYEHLRLAAAAEGARAVSNTEWTKHMGSCGFRFPPDRPPNYQLDFLASPRQPVVEHAIRKFLDVVEEELRGCRVLLDFCAPRWQPLPLPGSVDRSDIKSIGYRYGEYRFSLDRQAVLRLFMGEQLYSDPYVFIRELLQNAVDACRLNVYLHDVAQEDMAVRVSAWEDPDGFYWLRVDDTGVGMDQHIVEKYFLGVGRSYYRSDELQADILRKNKPQQKFTAISRFGIGVLSSFIVGNRIEVSTRRRLPDGTLAAPLRLSLDSLDDFFVMQEQPNQPSPFPGRGGLEQGYRKSPGTSVAVRIDPRKSDVALGALLDQARESFHYPPVRVYLNDAEQSDCRLAQLDVPLLAAPSRGQVTREPKFGVRANLPAAVGLTIAAFPLDLTANSPSRGVRGQIIALLPEVSGSGSLLPALPTAIQGRLPEDLVRALETCIGSADVFMAQDYDTRELTISLFLSIHRPALRALREWFQGQADSGSSDGDPVQQVGDQDFQALFGDPDLEDSSSLEDAMSMSASYPIDMTSLVGEQAAGMLFRDWLGHNGIRVPVRLRERRYPGASKLGLLPRGEGILFGPVSLSDQLRPDVSVSRDGLRGLSFDIRSALQLAVRRAAAVYLDGPERRSADVLMHLNLLDDLRLRDVTTGQVEADPLADQWRGEQIFLVGRDDWRNLAEVQELARNGPLELKVGGYLWSRDLDSRSYIWHASFYNIYRSSLAERVLDVQITLVQDDDGPPEPEVTVCSAEQRVRPEGFSVLPPFVAVRYESPEILIAPYSPANLRNPIVAWFADHAVPLNTDYPALFAQFKRALAIVANNEEAPDGDMPPAESAADLLNATLDRMRRSVPYASPALSATAYAGEQGRLFSRP